MKYLNNNLKLIHRNFKSTKVFLNENKKTKEIETVLIGDFSHALYDDISSLSKNRDFVGNKICSKNFEHGTLGWKV
jgi:hypothetical protein